MSIVVTGATGHFGRLAVEALIERGVPASDITAGGRRTDSIADLAERGVRVVSLDYNQPESLREAFDGAEKVLLVSSSEVGKRAEQHAAAVAAASAAGVKHLVYTSAPKADTSSLILAPEHKATEESIRASGIPSTILRNGWYTENYLGQVEQSRASGELVASVGDGRVASASRRDFAEAAAVVLTEPGHEERVYELSGDVAWDYNELASAIGGIVEREVTFRPVSSEEHFEILKSVGLDDGTAGFVVALDGNTRDGLLAETSGDLSKLIGRPTTPLAEGLAAAVSLQGATA